MGPPKSQNGNSQWNWELAGRSLAAAAAKLFRPAPRYYPRQVALITGGAQALALALAHRFGKAGLRLVLTGPSEAELQAARAELLAAQSIQRPEDVLLVPFAQSDREQGQGPVEAALSAFGRIDLVYCGEGFPDSRQVEAQPVPAITPELEGSVQGTLRTLQAALPYLLEPTHGDESNRGIILLAPNQTASAEATHHSDYAANPALNGFFRETAALFSPKIIGVTIVYSGLSGAQNPTQDAEQIYRAVQRGRSRVTLKQQAPFSGNAFRTVPQTTPDPR
jgi:NAD(P)-dependent dehydrogenase (short-subunit alcohol dehydrogenase family)